MDKILIKDLFLRCTIGVSAEERREKQDIVINITLLLDLHQSGKTDDMDDTVNYRDLKKRIIMMVEHSQYSLVEALSERIASLCLECPGVIEAQVIVEKPGALRFARSVGIEVIRTAQEVKPFEVFIGIGSNINPQENILKSIEHLKKQLILISSSNFYQTQALGNSSDPSFINGVIKIETKASPESLKHLILRPIEELLGRKRNDDKNAPRTIDLDILLYGNLVIKQDNLIIPDPEIKERNFLLLPLAEIAPLITPPGWTQSLGECARKSSHKGMKLLAEFSDLVRQKEIEKFSELYLS